MRLALLDPILTLSLDPARLVELFRARRAPLPFDPAAPAEDIARAMFVSLVDDAVAADVAHLDQFGDDLGARAIVEAARACKRDLSKWPLHEAPESLVARFLTAHAESPDLLRVWRRARIRRGRWFASVPSYDLVARSPRAPVAKELREARLAAALRRVFGDDLLAVFAVEDDATGDVHAAALLLGPARAEVTWDARRGFVRKEVRCVVSLRVTYDPDAARLRVKTRAPEDLLAVGAACGEALFDDAAYFSDGPSFTHKTLMRDGAASLATARLPDGIARMRIVAAQHDSLDDARVEARGDRSWDALTARTGLDGGYITRSTVRCDVRGEEMPVDAFLQLPYRIDVSDRTHERLVRRALTSLGWMDPGALPDDGWTLAPYAHPEWRWIEVIGEAAFRALVALGLLVKRRGARVAGAAFRRLGSSYVTFEVPGEPGVRYALSEDLSVPARDVREEELMVYELDTAALAEKMRRELGAKPAGSEVAGVVNLGLVTIGSARLCFFYAMRAGDTGLAKRIVAACKKGTVPVVLVPAGRKVSDALREVPLSLREQMGVDGVAHLLARVAEELELDDVEPWRLTDARIVVERATERVWIDGVRMKLAAWSYRMIECLALHAGQLVPSKEIAAHIVGRRGSLDGVIKKARPDLLKRVEESFGAAGVPVPEGVLEGLAIVEGKRGYRMALTAHVV